MKNTDTAYVQMSLLRTLSRLGLGHFLTVEEEIRLTRRIMMQKIERDMFSSGPCAPNMVGVDAQIRKGKK